MITSNHLDQEYHPHQEASGEFRKFRIFESDLIIIFSFFLPEFSFSDIQFIFYDETHFAGGFNLMY